MIFLLVATIIPALNGAAIECFPNKVLPALVYPASNTYGGAIHSTIASETLQSVFSGGRSDIPGIATPFIMRVNIDTKRVHWRRYYTSLGMDTIIAMAIAPDAANIAVFGQSYDNNIWQEFGFIFVIKTNDGGHVNNAIKVIFGRSGKAEHIVYDNGMTYTAAGDVYLAFYQVSVTKRDADNNAFSNYAGRMLVGSYSVAGNKMNWLNEQALWFGYSTALVYKNYCTGCANLFVGGVIDFTHID